MVTRTGHKTELDSLRECFGYNSYVRKKYLQALERLPPEELEPDRGASYPSILKIFIHVLDAYRLSLMIEYPRLSDEVIEQLKDANSLQEAKELEKEGDSFVMSFIEGLDEEKLESKFETTMSGKREEFTVSQMLWHMVEEQLQHIGELNALLWQLNIDPPTHAWFSSELAWTH
jgi:uncharacterized damage-inducible protein DinB